MKKKVVNIALDLETLSRRSTAAIIGIAAKAFSLGESKVTGEKNLPWKYLNVRDSRTFIYEGVRLIDPTVEDPYSIIPHSDGWVEHDAMSDCRQLIHNVTWVNDKISELLAANKSKKNADETAEQV